MNLTRKYKIHRLTPCLNANELEIISFIESKIKELKPIKNDKNPETTFYNDSKGQTILQRDDKNDRLWVKYYNFWEVLEDKYLLKSTDIEDIIQLMVFIHLKFRSSTPERRSISIGSMVSIHLKFRSSTPKMLPPLLNSFGVYTSQI